MRKVRNKLIRASKLLPNAVSVLVSITLLFGAVPVGTVYAKEDMAEELKTEYGDVPNAIEEETENEIKTEVSSEESSAEIDENSSEVESESQETETFREDEENDENEVIEEMSKEDIETEEMETEEFSIEETMSAEEYSYEEAFHYEKTVGKTKITIDAPAGVLPDCATAKITLFHTARAKENVKEVIESQLNATADKDTEYKVVGVNAYDITILKDGVEIQPRDEYGKVSVEFSNINITTEEHTTDDVKYLQVFYIDDTCTTAEYMDAKMDVEEEKVTFETDHFTTYAIAAIGGSISFGEGTRSVTLPGGEYTITARGAGGVNAYATNRIQAGNGGFAQATFRFDKKNTYTIEVGNSGGSWVNADDPLSKYQRGGSPYGGNGAHENYDGTVGSGGGLTGVSVNGSYLIVAGGGAGGSSFHGGDFAEHARFISAHKQGGNDSANMGSHQGGNGGCVRAYVYYGGGGGGYRGGVSGAGGSSYIASEAVDKSLIKGGGNGQNQSGNITITWNSCNHGDVVYTPLGDYHNHSVVCDGCGEILAETAACVDEDDDGLCDLCDQRISPYFEENNTEYEVTEYQKKEVSFTVKPVIMEGFDASLQWGEIVDGEFAAISGATDKTLTIPQDEECGTHKYQCRMEFEGLNKGVKYSAIKTLDIQKAEAYLFVSEHLLDVEYGEKNITLDYKISDREDFSSNLYQGQLHGGHFIFTSSDETTATAAVSKGDYNEGTIIINVKNAGTTTIGYSYTEGTNYQAIAGGFIDVTVSKTGITEFKITQYPKQIKYLDESAEISYRYVGINESADGLLQAFAVTESQYDDKEVLSASIDEEAQTIAIHPINAGLARININVTKEGRNYLSPVKSGMKSDAIQTGTIEILPADGVIAIDPTALKDNTIHLTREYGTDDDGRKAIAFYYNANNDTNTYGHGNVASQMEHKGIVNVHISNAQKRITMIPLKNGTTSLKLYATEGVNYTACEQTVKVQVLSRILADGYYWDFDEYEDGKIKLVNVTDASEDKLFGRVTIKEAFDLDGREALITTVGTGTFKEGCGAEAVFVPDTITRLEKESIHKSIKIITAPGSAAEKYAKENGNLLTIVTKDYTYDVFKDKGQWVAKQYLPASAVSGVATIPAKVDGYVVVSVSDEIIDIKELDKLVLESDDITLPANMFTSANTGLEIVYPSFVVTISQTGNPTNLLVKDKEGIVNMPYQCGGSIIEALDRNSIGEETTELRYDCNLADIPQTGYFFSDGNTFTQDMDGLKITFNDISFTVRIDAEGNVTIENYDVSDKDGVITVPDTIWDIPVVSVEEGLVDDTTTKVIMPDDEMTVPGSWFEKYPGLVIEKPSFVFVIGADETVEDYKPSDSAGTITIPDKIEGRPVISIDQETITEETDKIIITNPEIILKPENFENAKDDLVVEKPEISYIISKDEEGNIIIKDFNVTDKNGVIDVPANLGGFPVVSVSKDLTDDTTTEVIIRGENTMLPEDSSISQNIIMVVVKDSPADEFANERGNEEIRYLAIGGIKVRYTGARVAVNKEINTAYVEIVGYWNRERTESGMIAWESLTEKPTSLLVKSVGENVFRIAYYGEKGALAVQGYKQDAHSQNGEEHGSDKDTGSNIVDSIGQGMENQQGDMKELTIPPFVDMTSEETLAAIADMAGIQTVQSMQTPYEEDKQMIRDIQNKGAEMQPEGEMSIMELEQQMIDDLERTGDENAIADTKDNIFTNINSRLLAGCGIAFLALLIGSVTYSTIRRARRKSD